MDTLLQTLGITVEDYSPDNFKVAVTVSSRLYQPAGIVHGGVFVVLAETAASMAAAVSIDLQKFNVAGMEINANHIKPVRDGIIYATAKPVHRGKRTHVYSIEVTNNDQLVSISRCTIAIIAR